MHMVGLKDSLLCTCGEPESVKHYIEDCEQHVEIREKLMSKMFFTIGSSKFSCKMFLEVKAEDDLQECREILNEIFEEYILSTKRFKTQFFFNQQPNLTNIPQSFYYGVIPKSPITRVILLPDGC